MIKIQRTCPEPKVLLTNGSSQIERDCLAYDESPEEFRSGRKRFPVRSYYNQKEVKDLLMRIHHGKCCYCEKRLERRDLQVEHFRPRGAFRQETDGTNEYPGYYWLAYSWDNLLLACPTCNGTKGEKFPLHNPGQRARCHNDDISIERELLVNPAVDDPRDHIRFEYDAPYPLTERGRRTINELQLRRNELAELRLAHIGRFRFYRIILRSGLIQHQTGLRHEMARELKEAVREDSEFSSMVMDLLGETDPLLEHIEQSGN